ncbi:MAG: Ppx/GppA family phosphatase [Proteobacteria bacterium]|nr:Ppx/GppA family phosphatase [Pseudomonadota bacterium]
MKIASIDIGTNTLRLLIGAVQKDGHIIDSHLMREITRLGGGFDGKRLHPDSEKRTLRAVKIFSDVIKEAGVKKVRASATSVVREAENGKEFIDEIKSLTGINVDIISGDIEAALTLKGVLSALYQKESKALVFDIGGGSTEYIIAESGKVIGLNSLNMGVVSLTEKYLKSDPPSADNLSNIRSAVDSFLLALKTPGSGLPELSHMGGNSGSILVGTAGTITTLAALDQNLEIYDSRKINNYVLTKDAIDKLFKRLSGMTHEERVAIKALEEGRADLIIAGTIIVQRTMEEFGFNELVVSDYGLLEGLLIDEAERQGLT